MLPCLVIRRFKNTKPGEPVTEVVRTFDLPLSPSHGMILDFDDGTPEATVSIVRLKCYRNRPPGIYGVSVQLRCTLEPAAALDAVLLAGWVKLEAAA